MKDNIKMGLAEVGYRLGSLIQDRVQWRTLGGNVRDV
jgi:hypothetical protein